MSDQSLLLWDGTKATPSEQLTNPDSCIGTDSAGEIGAFPLPGPVAPTVLPHKLYVGTCDPATTPNGSISAPFQDLPDALAYISGRVEQWVEIHISSGEYNGVDFPAGKTIALISDSGGVFISHCRFTADGSNQSRFIGRNLVFQSLDTNSPSSGTDIYNVKLEDCTINEAVSNSGGCDLRLVFDRVVVAKELNSTYLTATDSEFGQTLTTELLKATRCTMPESMKLAGMRAEFYACSFPVLNASVVMTNGGGGEVAFFDKDAAMSFAAIDGDVVGGEPESQQDGPWLIRTDDTFVEGQCAYMRTPTLVRACTGNGLDSSIMVGIVVPAQPTPNRLALVWGKGRVPVTGYPDRALYRDSSGIPVPFGSIHPGDYTQRVGQCDGVAIYLQIGEELKA